MKLKTSSLSWNKPSCIPYSIISVVTFLVVFLILLDLKIDLDKREQIALKETQWNECQNTCKASIVESIPEGLIYNETIFSLSTYDAWVKLLDSAEKEIAIGSFYWSLQGKEFDHPTADKGKDIFHRIIEAGKRVKIRIAQNIDSKTFPNFDTADLVKLGAAEVRKLNFTKLVGSGIIHTKMWVVDDKHVYVGSANFDWRSLTQVKELGILITDCPCYAQDIKKIFNVYWDLGKENATIPDKWPSSYNTDFGMNNQMKISFNDLAYSSYISSSPPQFCPKGRTNDIDSISNVIQNATQFIYVAVMDYYPATIYTKNPKYWPIIDDELRSAAIDKKIKIRLMMSVWNDTRSSAYNFLHSLEDLNNVYPHVDIEIKLFEVSSTPDQAKIPFARVNHNKYMVTDNAVYIGTSNWSGDYFISTGGVGIIMYPVSEQNGTNIDIRKQALQIFKRDWNSKYARPLKSNFKS